MQQGGFHQARILVVPSWDPNKLIISRGSEDNVDMDRLGQDIHNDNPGEELNYHGLVNSTERNEREGKNYGYPVYFAIWETLTVTGVDNARVGMQITGGQPTGEYTDTWCAANTEEPRLTLPAHTAPLDIKFRHDGSAVSIN